MITITQAVEEEVNNSPLLQAGLKEEILNLSAVARELMPVIQERTFKDVSVNAIQLALQRLDRTLFARQKIGKTGITQIEITNHLVMVVGPTASLLLAASQAAEALPANSQLIPQLYSNEKIASLVFSRDLESTIRPKLSGKCQVYYDKSLVRIELSSEATSNNASVLGHQLFWRSIDTDVLNVINNRAILIVDNKKAKSLSKVLELLVEN